MQNGKQRLKEKSSQNGVLGSRLRICSLSTSNCLCERGIPTVLAFVHARDKTIN